MAYTDHKGRAVPTHLVPKEKKIADRHARQIAKAAHRLQAQTIRAKKNIIERCLLVYDAYCTAKDIDKTKVKGNHTFYSFDRQYKIEVTMSNRIEYDKLLLDKAKSLLDEYIIEKTGADGFIAEMITEAFGSSKGQADHKKLSQLLKYRKKVNDERYQTAMDLLVEAAEIVDTKTYINISERNPDGSYSIIVLNYTAL